MKKLLVFLLPILILLPLQAQAAQPADQALKIGIIDVQKVLAESKTVQNYRAQLGKEVEANQKTFNDKQKAAAQLDERLTKGQSTMSDRDKRALQDELSNAMKDLQRMKEDMELDLKKRDRDLSQKMIKEIDEIVNQIFEKEGYTIIFEKNAAGVLKFKSTLDITDRVIKAYDKK